jgi:hypothetical protein
MEGEAVPKALRILAVVVLLPSTLAADSGHASDRAGQLTESNRVTQEFRKEVLRERMARLLKLLRQQRATEVGPWVYLNDWFWDADAHDADPPR